MNSLRRRPLRSTKTGSTWFTEEGAALPLPRYAVRADDTVVRLGGDEFAIVIAGGDASIAVRVADRIVAAVGESFEVAGTEVRVGASVGVAISGGGGRDGNQLLRDADMAMYQVKQGSRGGFAVYREPDVRLIHQAVR
ncbi:diguanylate cyclase [Dactylosporangium cerinum]